MPLFYQLKPFEQKRINYNEIRINYNEIRINYNEIAKGSKGF